MLYTYIYIHIKFYILTDRKKTHIVEHVVSRRDSGVDLGTKTRKTRITVFRRRLYFFVE